MLHLIKLPYILVQIILIPYRILINIVKNFVMYKFVIPFNVHDGNLKVLKT